MANEIAIRFLTDKITALQIVQQELTQIYARITDLTLADQVRAQITSLNERLFALESARNNLVAAENEVPPPGDDRLQALTAALRQLDAYVRNDQNIHMALNYLVQVAELVRTA